jgi:hypothetical protein
MISSTRTSETASRCGKGSIITWIPASTRRNGASRRRSSCCGSRRRWAISGPRFPDTFRAGTIFTSTDNNIKNHFYSILRRTVRWLNKELGKHKIAGTGTPKQIKNETLSKIIAASVSEVETGHEQLASTILKDLYEIGIRKSRNLLSPADYLERCEVVFRNVLEFKKEIKKGKETDTALSRGEAR